MQRKVSLFAFLLIPFLTMVLPTSAESDLSSSYNQLFMLLSLVSFAVLLLVVVLWVYFMYKFREDNEEVEREEIPHSTSRKLEVGWTAVAILIIIILMALSYPILFNETTAAEDPSNFQNPITIVVEGTASWTWKYHLPNGTVIEPVVVQKDAVDVHFTNITLTKDQAYTFIFFNTAPFIHSYFVKGLNIKMDVVPGTNNSLTFIPTKVGANELLCAEFCGALHSQMRGWVNVEEA